MKNIKFICLMTGLFSSGILVNNLNADDMNDTKKKSSQLLNDKISKVAVAAKQLVERPFTSGKLKDISKTKDASIKNANAAIKAYAWGDAEKKAIAEKCIQELSKYYKISGFEEEDVFKTFNAINDRRKAEKILKNIIKAYQSNGYKNVPDIMREDIFCMIFNVYKQYDDNKEYCKHDRLEILEFMTEKSVPAAVEIATSEDCKNKMTDVKRDGIIPYILGSADETELNFRKKVAQEYIKLVTSENNGKSIEDGVALEISEKLFKSANEQELDQKVQETKSKYHRNYNHLKFSL